MKPYYQFVLLLFYLASLTLTSCKRINEVNQDPEIESLKHGFKVSAAIGYCASLAYTFFEGENLPDNVVIQSQNNSNDTETCIMLVSINESFPLPFNASVGHIFLHFHDRCDGRAYVEFACGKYLSSTHKNVNLNFQ